MNFAQLFCIHLFIILNITFICIFQLNKGCVCIFIEIHQQTVQISFFGWIQIYSPNLLMMLMAFAKRKYSFIIIIFVNVFFLFYLKIFIIIIIIIIMIKLNDFFFSKKNDNGFIQIQS